MEAFTICVIYKAKGETDRVAFVDEMKSAGVLDLIKNEDGCLKYEYYFSDEDKNKIVLFEQWRDKDAQKVHMTQPHMQAAMAIKGKYIESVELKEIKIV